MKYADIEWRGNQPYSTDFNDIYYSDAGIRQEAEHVFLKNNNLQERLHFNDKLVIAETGFGFGLNFILTLRAWHQHAKQGSRLHYIGIEKHPVSPDDIRRLSNNWPDLSVYFDELLSIYPAPVVGHHTRALFDGGVNVHFIFMDVIESLMHDRFNVDAWYLDGFAPQKNPDLWSEQVFRLIAQNSKRDATLSTYTSAGSVKRGLIAAGFDINKVKGFGNKREMITAVLKNKADYKNKTPWFDVPLQEEKNKTALVVGAGLAGLSAAWALVRRGWCVSVIDRHNGVAQEASGNAAGLVLPRLSIDNSNDSIFYTNAFLYAVNQLDSLQKVSNEKFWFKKGVYSLLNRDKATKIITKNNFSGLFASLLSGSDVPESLSEWSGGSIFFPEAGWAIPPKICEAIVRAGENNVIQISAAVDDLVFEDNLWNAIDKNGEVIVSADVAIIANGTEANKFSVTSWLPVLSARGQTTVVQSDEKSSALISPVSFDGYVTPAHNGMHVVGASYSLDDETKDLNSQDQNDNLDRLNRHLPDVFLQPDKLDGRVGFRAVSEDRIPVVGAVPDKEAFTKQYSDLYHGRPVEKYSSGEYLPGLYITAAHGSRGMCSCFLSAEIIASMADQDLLPVNKNISDYINPARFIIRKLKRYRPTGM